MNCMWWNFMERGHDGCSVTGVFASPQSRYSEIKSKQNSASNNFPQSAELSLMYAGEHHHHHRFSNKPTRRGRAKTSNRTFAFGWWQDNWLKIGNRPFLFISKVLGKARNRSKIIMPVRVCLGICVTPVCDIQWRNNYGGHWMMGNRNLKWIKFFAGEYIVWLTVFAVSSVQIAREKWIFRAVKTGRWGNNLLQILIHVYFVMLYIMYTIFFII